MSGPRLLGQMQADRPLAAALEVALRLDQPTSAELVAAGIPQWEADRLLRRLHELGEVHEGVWQSDIRSAYLAALAKPPPAATTRAPAPGSPLARPEGDRPREKALRLGIDALGDDELLALLLRTGGSEGALGLAASLLKEHGGILGLARCSAAELMQVAHVGEAKATELAAAFELGKRLARASLGERPVLKDPEQVAAFLGPSMSSLTQEELWCLPLDNRCRLMAEPMQISRGDVDGTDAGPRVVYRLLVRLGASSCIIAHNHPSGDPSPSAADRAITRRLAQAGRLLGIELSDHLIIGDRARYSSLRRLDPELFRN